MKLAFVDLLWNWPPRGGADIDLYHVAAALQARGHAVRVLAIEVAGVADQGAVDPAQVPFAVTRLAFTRANYGPDALVRRVDAALQDDAPDVVVVADGFHMKPHLLRGLARWPLVARYYAYEGVCISNLMHMRDGAPCPLALLETPDICRRCATASLAARLRTGAAEAWPTDYLAARAYAPDYARVAAEGLAACRAVIASNPQMAAQLAPHTPHVAVVPGGCDAARFEAAPPSTETPHVILLPGRAEDPLKGLPVLLAAGERLASHRDDFAVWATAPEDTPGPPWFQALGWQPRAAMPALYARAAVVAAPSTWEEPFGLIALEAMACGRPVVASDTAGLATIVRHESNGLLAPPGDAAALADALARLLDHGTWRAQLGATGRAQVAAHYTWEHVVATHHEPLYRRVAEGG